MRTARLYGDLALVEQGVEVAVGFGVRSLEGLLGVAELIKANVYEARSLRATADGLSFTILNPPLRMGAFSSVRLFVDGEPVAPSDGELVCGVSPARRLDSIDRGHPVSLAVGERTTVSAVRRALPPGRVRVRLELQSVAIPPLVWMEFEDDLAPARGPA